MFRNNYLLWCSWNHWFAVIRCTSALWDPALCTFLCYCQPPQQWNMYRSLRGTLAKQDKWHMWNNEFAFPCTLGWYVHSAFIVFSAPGGHLERHRSIERKRSEQRGPKHGAQRGPTGGCALHHLLPAQQKDANHTPNPGGAVHQPPVKLPAGSLRSVSSLWNVCDSLRVPSPLPLILLGLYSKEYSGGTNCCFFLVQILISIEFLCV